MGLFDGMLGNYSQVSNADLEREYSPYLMPNEKIQVGFKLVRDALIFTDKRLLFTDKQGATGTKMRIVSINLASIINVTMETSGFGLDDSEITFTYLSNPYLKSHNPSFAQKKIEFPKGFDVQSIYRFLQNVAFINFQKINS